MGGAGLRPFGEKDPDVRIGSLIVREGMGRQEEKFLEPKVLSRTLPINTVKLYCVLVCTSVWEQ